MFFAEVCNHRCLTTRQCVVAGLASQQMARRYIRELCSEGLLQRVSWPSSNDTGRPENLVIPTRKGLRISHRSSEKVLDSRCYTHQYHLNWCRIWFSSLSSQALGLRCTFLPERPGGSCAKHRAIVPDAVLLMQSQPLDKSLLFFLEMDMGSEPLSGRKGGGGSLEEKIIAYRELFVSKGYRRFAPDVNRLRGFRVLFILSKTTRLRQIVRLCEQLSPCPFVWSVDFDTLGERGAGAPVWFRGGEHTQRHSILGSLAK